VAEDIALTLHASRAALRKASRRITQFYDTALASAGLTVTQYSLLTELVKRRAVAPTVTELADAMVMDRSGLGHTLGPLERDGLITLAVDSHDARARNVVLTVKGKALQRQATISWRHAQKAVCRHLWNSPGCRASCNFACDRPRQATQSILS